ncbi:MAG: SGNH/GDSL hydrolase family protein [Candidatus Omnitrophica bacterium]|nr:SGNH/GDSL hydrolase family protein [Candidatus Omnitrophota bacterium]
MPRKKDVLVLLFSVVFLFFCFELFIRLSPHLYCLGYRPVRNQKLVFELQPGYKIKEINAEISSQGLNDRYYSLIKPQGVYRIAVIGDSTSFGWKVGSENSFPKILERRLNEGKSQRYDRYEVINFSVPGYNTAQELAVLKEKVVKFNPDLVILCYCSNDIYLCNLIQPDLSILNYLYNRSFFIHYLLYRIDSAIIPKEKNDIPLGPRPTFVWKGSLITLIRDLNKFCLWYRDKAWILFKKKILRMFYYEQRIYPYPELEAVSCIQVNPIYLQKRVPSKYWYMLGLKNYRIHLSNINNFLKKNNIEFVSAGFFDTEPLKINKELNIKNILNFSDFLSREGIYYQKIIFADDWHMNIRGHSLCAEFIYEKLKNIWNTKGE